MHRYLTINISNLIFFNRILFDEGPSYYNIALAYYSTAIIIDHYNNVLHILYYYIV